MGHAPALTDAPVVVRVRGLTKRYGRRTAVEDASLDVVPGEIHGVIGPDGAGKSSLLKAIAGVLTFDAGDLEVFGRRIDSEHEAGRVMGRIGFMPQGLGLHLYPELSVDENIDFFAAVRLVAPGDLGARKSRLLDMARLRNARDRPAKHLSGGMKQKLGLVCTLIHQPEFIILDEPTTGVDPPSRQDFWALLSDLLEETRGTALVSTAYMDEATEFDRVALMFDGRLVADLSAADLRHAGARTEEIFIRVLEQSGIARIRPEPAPVVWAPDARRPAGAAIEAMEVSRTFGRHVAVDRVSLRVDAGEIVALVGPNGAGKSTMIRMLTGLLPPTSGTTRVAGTDLRAAPVEVRRRIGYMSQQFSLYRDLTVEENLRLYAGIYGLGSRTVRERFAWVLDMAGLEGREHTMTEDLPMGLRQRLALGCALIHHPDMLCLDEPTAGVDPIGRRRFWDVLRRLTREAGVAVLLSTHDLGEAERCDRLALMYAGRIVADAPPATLTRQTAESLGLEPNAELSLREVFVERIRALESDKHAAGRRA